MRIGEIPEYQIDISDDQEGIEMVRVFINDRTSWVDLHNPHLDGKCITRDKDGCLVAK